MVKNVPLNMKGFHPFGELIGLTFTKLEKGYSQCTLEVVDKLLNPHKVVHAGCYFRWQIRVWELQHILI